MGLAPVAYTCGNVLRYDRAEPNWPNRNRLVLSNGHASMLLYSLLVKMFALTEQSVASIVKIETADLTILAA
jgi:transketolase